MLNHRYLRGALVALALSLLSPLLNAATDQQTYTATAQSIADGFTQRDPAPFNNALDVESILDTVFDGLLVNPQWELDMRRGLKQGLRTQLGERIISQMPQEGFAKLLRVKMVDDGARALMRLDYGDNGNGYMDMHLSLDEAGNPRITDWFGYATGQRYSESLRQTVATLASTPTALGKLFDFATDKDKYADALKELIRLNKAQQYAEMVRYFLASDETIRSSRLLNIIIVQAANKTNDLDLYRRALGNVAHYFGDDETILFLLIDYYFLEEDYGKVIEASHTLQKSFGVEDAGMVVFESNALFQRGDYPKAIAVANHAIELEPEYEYSYWSLINAQLGAKQFAAATETAKALEGRFGYDMGPDSLAGSETYAPLVQSEPYRIWRASLQ